jgi:outer membrane immunogenic protein
MKKILVATAAFLSVASSAFAADIAARPMAVKAPMVTMVPFNWTGCYLGVAGGYQWGRSEQIAQSGKHAGQSITGEFDLSGGIAGGTVGCNYQFSNNVVIGLENDFSWTDKSGSAFDHKPFNTKTLSTTSEKWIDTLRGRLGYAFDRFMVYGTGGVAFAGTEVNVDVPGFGSVTDSQTRTGWVAGVGAEWAAYTGPQGALTVKFEYLHADFGTSRYVNTPVNFVKGSGCNTQIQTVASRDVKLSDDMVRVGLNWKFNSDPVITARY